VGKRTESDNLQSRAEGERGHPAPAACSMSVQEVHRPASAGDPHSRCTGSPSRTRRAADCLQRALRSRFRQQLTRSVREKRKR
jgi:hypothetical protein